MRDHAKLRALEPVDEMVLLVYQVTRKFPKEEIYCLAAQMRKANAKNQQPSVYSLNNLNS